MANQFDVNGLIAAAFANLPPHVAALLGRYRLCDIAFKAVGVGSVGTYCTIALFMSPDDEPLFMQMKEASSPCWSASALASGPALRASASSEANA